MYGLKDWAMEVNYNACKKTLIQQEKEDVRDETIDSHGLTIKNILKRLNDLEEMVQDQGDLLEEQTLIIESNKEKSCMLERIVEEQRIIIESNNERIGLLERIVEENKKSLTEKLSGLDDIVDDHRQLLNEVIDEIVVEREKVKTLQKLVKCEKENNHKLIVCDKKQFLDSTIVLQGQIDNLQYSSMAIYINHAVIRIITDLTRRAYTIGSMINQEQFICFRESLSKSTLQQVVTTIDSEWTNDVLFDVVNSTIRTFHDKTTHILNHAINHLPADVVVQEALLMIEGCSECTRKMFSSEEKILRSHEKLKPLYEYLVRWDNSQNKFDTR
jgi:hypothetical protein